MLIDAPSPIQIVPHLRGLMDQYEVFVFPVFGTLHNGQKLSEDAFFCLQKLSENRKTVAIFSNVPKRRQALIQDLANIGVPPSLYQHVITSGEEAYHALKTRDDPFHARLGDRVFVIGSSDAFQLIDGLGLKRETFVDEADFILALGPDEWHSNLDYYKPILQKAYNQGLPMVCASPDLHVEYQSERAIRAGALAHFYETLGGDVFYHGKPYRPFYRSLLADLEPLQPEDVLVLGDSYLTDIKGASKIGLDSLLCLSATTRVDFELAGLQQDYDAKKAVKNVSMSDSAALKSVLESQDYCPTYLMEALRW